MTGACFGALKPETAQDRIVAVTSCHLAVITQADLQKSIAIIKHKQQEDDFVRHLPFFSCITHDKAMLLHDETLTVPKGKVLVREGLSNNFVYIIKSGEFSVRRKLEAGLQARGPAIGAIVNEGFTIYDRSVMSTKIK